MGRSAQMSGSYWDLNPASIMLQVYNRLTVSEHGRVSGRHAMMAEIMARGVRCATCCLSNTSCCLQAYQ